MFDCSRRLIEPRAALEAAGIRAAVRGDAIGFSLHVWNDAADVDRAVEAIRQFL